MTRRWTDSTNMRNKIEFPNRPASLDGKNAADLIDTLNVGQDDLPERCISSLLCSTEGCPFAGTEESEHIQGYGCLPSSYEIAIMRIKHGKTWACHSNPDTPCVGAIRNLKANGHPYKVIDKNLITERHDWSKFTK
ncbi:hypothetical protein [Neptuniibacter sp. QD37_11]|uniref:hypothetical protein n=1 Tax=Neptuniibacter sp. QD37_11 TaxID=3398209 RepID=UPI0039F565B9